MLRAIVAASAILLSVASTAQAQAPWPNKPVKILVPTAAGGTADSTARMFALHLSKVLGQQFYIENRGGAGNTLGIESVVRSPADGYTLLLGAGTITINHLIYKKLPYDVVRDLTPVTQMVSVPNVLVVHPSQPMKTLADYIDAAKAKPGQVNYASAGVGSNLHLAMELLKFRTGIDVMHVPYKGVGPAHAGHARRSRHVDGVERRLGQAARRRRQAPRARRDIAQAHTGAAGYALGAETGIKDYEVLNWFGLFAPVGTPQAIVDRLQAEAAAMFADPETNRRLAGEGAEPVASKPADFAMFVRAEIKKWDEVGKAANIQPTE